MAQSDLDLMILAREAVPLSRVPELGSFFRASDIVLSPFQRGKTSRNAPRVLGEGKIALAGITTDPSPQFVSMLDAFKASRKLVTPSWTI